MIKNDLGSQLGQYFNQKNNKADAGEGSRANAAFQRLKAQQGPKSGKAAAAPTEPKDANATRPADDNVSMYDKRKKELDAIMDRLNREEAERFPNRHPAKNNQTAETASTGSAQMPSLENIGALGFLNDMPLFNEFKTGLSDAFKMLDGATAGSINAQYELNYTAMQYMANDAGAYEYTETNLSIKLDLNYIKAASGGQTGKEIASAIENSKDFGELVENLKNVGQQDMAAAKQKFDPKDFMASLQDYFSPESTANRIVDFAAALYDGKGDRGEFGETMRKAIQKGFDQAMGILGKVPQSVQDGIDKTHSLTMKGLDDFIANGRNPAKTEQGVYSGLEQYTFSFEMNYSQKTVSYNAHGAQQGNPAAMSPALDTKA
jgi:hypothetical protein